MPRSKRVIETLNRMRDDERHRGDKRLIAVRGEYPFGLGWNMVDATEYRREVATDHRIFNNIGKAGKVATDGLEALETTGLIFLPPEESKP